MYFFDTNRYGFASPFDDRGSGGHGCGGSCAISPTSIQHIPLPQSGRAISPRPQPAHLRRRGHHPKVAQAPALCRNRWVNTVVRKIDKDGKWVEVEYYHWLHEEYRTGWVLKKYLERVPANYSKARGQ